MSAKTYNIKYGKYFDEKEQSFVVWWTDGTRSKQETFRFEDDADEAFSALEKRSKPRKKQ